MNEIQVKQILSGHISPETAYNVDDYPYGGLRCKIRYWLEYVPKKGVRFWSQTTNPKSGHIWNKAKCSTYCEYGGSMFLNEKNHVHWSGVTCYGDSAELISWREKFGAGVPEACKVILDKWIEAKVAYENKKKEQQISLDKE